MSGRRERCQWTGYRDREIWVHCAVGQTSYNAVRLLEQHGFKVRNLSGGMTSYKMEG